MIEPSYFETDRLLLRRTAEEDANFMIELFNSSKWLEFIGDRHVYTQNDAIQYIRNKITPLWENSGFGNFTVIRKNDGQKLGSCGLYDREGVEGIDIGFAFLPQYEGQGYAYEAAVKIRDAAFGKFGLKKISAITTKTNLSSQKLLDKLGLHFKAFIHLPGDEEEIMLYEMEKEA